MKRKKSASYETGLLERLKDREYSAGYLSACLEIQEGDAEGLFLLALRDVIMAHGGIKSITKNTHISQKSVCKILCGKGTHLLVAIFSILDALGLKLIVVTKKVKEEKTILSPLPHFDEASKRIIARIKKGFHLGKFKVPLTREGIYR